MPLKKVSEERLQVEVDKCILRFNLGVETLQWSLGSVFTLLRRSFLGSAAGRDILGQGRSYER